MKEHEKIFEGIIVENVPKMGEKRDIYRLKVRSWNKICHAAGDQKKVGVAILMGLRRWR